MPAIQDLESAFLKADALARSEQATPEQRAQAQTDAQTFATELKRQRGLQKVDENIPRGEFEYAIEKAPAKAPGVGTLAREIGTTMTLGTLGQAIGDIGDTDTGHQIGGAAGTGVANLINQFQRMAENPNEEFKWGELGSDIALGYAGAGPTLSAARMAVSSPTARAISGEAIRQGLLGLTAQTARKAVDRGELLTPEEAVLSFAGPAGTGATSRILASSPGFVTASQVPSVRSRTLEDARRLGLKTFPSETMPTASTQQLEKIAGPAALRQRIQLENAGNIKSAMNRYLKLAEDTDVTVPLLKQIREKAKEPYQQAGKIAEKAQSELNKIEQDLLQIPDPIQREIARSEPSMAKKIGDLTAKTKADPQALRQIKSDMDDAFYAWRQSGGDPRLLEKAQALRKNYEAASDAFEQAVTLAGESGLVKQLKDARQLIARTYNAEEALNLGDAGYDPKILMRMLDRGVPLGDEAEKIAKFTTAFNRNVAEQGAVGTSGGGMFSGFWAPVYSAGKTLAATGRPGLALAAGVAPGIAKEMATKRLLSEGFQRKAAEAIAPRVFLNPNAAVGTAALRYAGQLAGKAATTTRPVTQADIEDLRDNPDLAEEFDRKFGAGEANKYLARKRR